MKINVEGDWYINFGHTSAHWKVANANVYYDSLSIFHMSGERRHRYGLTLVSVFCSGLPYGASYKGG